jgi:four helix bundle protein
MQDYTKLGVWQKSYQLSLNIYRATKPFPKEELYGLVNQMRRAAVSVPANIAEGCGRFTDADFAHFLDIAMGSLFEVDCYIRLSQDLAYISPESYQSLESDLVEVRRMLISLIQKVRPAKR